jgi:hypothetical protein
LSVSPARKARRPISSAGVCRRRSAPISRSPSVWTDGARRAPAGAAHGCSGAGKTPESGAARSGAPSRTAGPARAPPGDPHQAVVHCYRKLIGVHPVRTAHDKISAGLPEPLAPAAVVAVGKNNGLVWHGGAEGGAAALRLKPAPPVLGKGAAGAGMHPLPVGRVRSAGRQTLGPAAIAGIDQPLLLQRRKCRFIKTGPGALGISRPPSLLDQPSSQSRPSQLRSSAIQRAKSPCSAPCPDPPCAGLSYPRAARVQPGKAAGKHVPQVHAAARAWGEPPRSAGFSRSAIFISSV